MSPVENASLGSRPRRAPIRAVAVVVPAHDEEELLGACLDAITVATYRSRAVGLPPTPVIVVADSCTDASRATARVRGVDCLTMNGRNVGAARAAGAERALTRLADEGFSTSQTYLLHTDADTVVPPDWIVRHVAAAAEHDAVLGPIDILDWSARRAGSAELYARESALEPDEHRVHGANLGVRADAYLRVGGIPAVPVAEDRTFVEALRTAGESVVFQRDLTVYTSARVSRRVSGGFSEYLSRLESSIRV